MKRIEQIGGFFATLALALVCASCGQGKITQCNALIGVINKGVKNIDGNKGPADASGLKTVADTMDQIAAEAAQVKLSVAELQKFSTDYQGMAREVATAARAMAGALDAKDSGNVSNAQTAMEKAVKQEDALIEGINSFCQAP